MTRPQLTVHGKPWKVGRGPWTALLCFLLLAQAANAQVLNRIVAVVDDEILTEADLGIHSSC